MARLLYSIKLYLLLVLLPQLVYFFTKNSYGLAAVCESCSPTTYVDMYLSLLRDPASFTDDESVKSSECLGQATQSQCAIGDATAAYGGVEHTKYIVSANYKGSDGRHIARLDSVGEPRDETPVSSPCFCTSREFNNFSSDEEASLQSASDESKEGGWHISHSLPDLAGPCNIKRRNSSLSQMDFLKEFAYTEPVILTGVTDQAVFRAHSTRRRLLQDYGIEVITVATANTHSYRKAKMTFCEYVEKHMKPQTLESLGNETFYHFGDNDRERWDPLFSLYQLPPYQLLDKEPVLSFGLAGPGTGVPFHIHGPTFAETVYGRKRWFLYPPDYDPVFHPDVTTLHWAIHTYPSLQWDEKPLECTLNPGEVIYFPDRWWHATLNLDSAIFMSTFYS